MKKMFIVGALCTLLGAMAPGGASAQTARDIQLIGDVLFIGGALVKQLATAAMKAAVSKKDKQADACRSEAQDGADGQKQCQPAQGQGQTGDGGNSGADRDPVGATQGAAVTSETEAGKATAPRKDDQAQNDNESTDTPAKAGTESEAGPLVAAAVRLDEESGQTQAAPLKALLSVSGSRAPQQSVPAIHPLMGVTDGSMRAVEMAEAAAQSRTVGLPQTIGIPGVGAVGGLLKSLAKGR